MKTLKGGGAMERKEMQTTPAGRVFWSTIDAANRLHTFLIVEFTEDDYEEFWSLPSGVEKSVFLSEKLKGRKVFIPDGGYELEFPPYYDEYGRKDLFWYNNVYETYEEAYERLVEEWKKRLSDYYGEGEEYALEEEARERAEDELNNLPVVRI
jgi:hypothetical protein